MRGSSTGLVRATVVLELVPTPAAPLGDSAKVFDVASGLVLSGSVFLGVFFEQPHEKENNNATDSQRVSERVMCLPSQKFKNVEKQKTPDYEFKPSVEKRWRTSAWLARRLFSLMIPFHAQMPRRTEAKPKIARDIVTKRGGFVKRQPKLCDMFFRNTRQCALVLCLITRQRAAWP
jgi:hypothetical protein